MYIVEKIVFCCERASIDSHTTYLPGCLAFDVDDEANSASGALEFRVKEATSATAAAAADSRHNILVVAPTQVEPSIRLEQLVGLVHSCHQKLYCTVLVCIGD